MEILEHCIGSSIRFSGGWIEATDLAKEDGFRCACRVHHVLLHPAGPDKAPFRETTTCLRGASQPAPTLKNNHIKLCTVYS